jgi:hypothetical protein
MSVDIHVRKILSIECTSTRFGQINFLLISYTLDKMSSEEKNNISTVSALVLNQIDQSARGPTPFSHWG